MSNDKDLKAVKGFTKIVGVGMGNFSAMLMTMYTGWIGQSEKAPEARLVILFTGPNQEDQE